jgi:hypothetical protein
MQKHSPALGTFGCTYWRKLMVINRYRLAPYEGTPRDKLPYGGSSRNGWKVNMAENRATRRNVKPSTDVGIRALGKEMAVCL